MTRILMLVLAAPLAAMLGACGQQKDAVPAAPAADPAMAEAPAVDAEPALSAAPAAEAAPQHLRCGELDIVFWPADGAGSLQMHGLSIPLTPVMAASGARYTGSSGAEPVDFWSKGDEAQLTIGEREYPTCRQPEELLAPASDAVASGSGDGLSYRASGNEPSWSLDIAPASMELALDAGQRRVKGSPLIRVTRDGAQEFAARAGDTPMQAMITPEICRDSMSGLPRPDRVDLTLGDERWSGCGGDPAALLVGVEWQIVEIKGTPVLPGVPVSLRFQADGSVSGHASCNSLAARFSISGEGLQLSPPVTTKMACEEPVMQQEQALLEILADRAPKHDFDAEGRLLIRTSGGEHLVAKRG